MPGPSLARSSRLAALALALIPILGPTVSIRAAGQEPREAGHREVPDDPPAELDPRRAPRGPAATVVRGGHVSVQVNVDAAGNNIFGDAANEPSMAIDPTDPRNIVVGWRQFDTVASNFRQAGHAYSRDAGASWTFPGVLQPGQFRSDPVLAASADGTFYYYSLSTVASAEMFVSTDKGSSWLGPFAGFGGDKQWFTVDVSGSPGAGQLYALWNSQFTCCAPGTDFTRSIDGGFLYGGPWAMPVKVKWGTLDVAGDGTLFVVGSNLSTSGTPAHYVLRSSDAQNPAVAPTFERSTGVDLGGTTVAGGTPNPGGLLGQVWIAVDRSTGPGDPLVYVLGSVNPPGIDPLDVHLVRSADRGQTWSLPRRVNDDPPSGTAFQWFGAISVAPGGRLDVTWYDTRNDPSALTSEVYYAYSNSSGEGWSRGLPVTPPFNSVIGHPNQNKIGDYTHMVSDEVGAALAYAATFNGEQDVWFVRVGDCNGNGTHDSADILAGTSIDCDGSGHPDECEGIVEICNDGLDNDCDGATDCADAACSDDPGCQCDFDGTCDPGEDCRSCASDCPTGPAGCGNGVCQPNRGENCLTCPADCAGVQSGNPNNQYCCGDGGTNPVSCLDPRCNQAGFVCDKAYQPACCGDLVCEGGESPCSCAADCGVATASEARCFDGIDDDCDTSIDCADADCAGAPTAPPGGAPTLYVERAGDGGLLLRWDVLSGAVAFDVVEGDLATLSAGGDFATATTGCVADGLARLETGALAGAGDRWFLVRPTFCATTGSYDTGRAGQAAPRDAAIAAAPASCP